MATLTATTVTGTASATTFSGSGAGITNLDSSEFASATIANAKIAADGVTRGKINYAGAVLQCNMIRYDARPLVSAPGAVNGTALTQVRLSITPTYANSLIICEWYLAGECNSHDQGFRVGKNGTVVTTAGYQGYNTDVGQVNHSFITSDDYDANDSSTPNTAVIMYYDRPGSTAAVYYEPHVAAADGPARTWYFNRVVGSAGQGNHENPVSFGRIWEIKQ
jgi:hypothetical protein